MAELISRQARAYLRWALTDGVGPILFGRILIQVGDAEAALGAPAARLAEVKGIGREGAERVARGRDAADVDAEVAAAARHGVRIICRADPEFPRALRQIADAPIVLYVKGELRETDSISLAVVGSRRCTLYGSEQARRFGELLATAGFTVVSGLARGIDSFAQHGAVEAGGRSIGVLGCGLDTVYPPENKALADKLLESGALLSELPIRSAVQRENFPPRNRIIAGLTLGTLVVEAAKRSGALITARLANEYNREVFAVPGRVNDAMSQGANDLIRRGAAKLVSCLEDILDELGDVGARMRDAWQSAGARDPMLPRKRPPPDRGDSSAGGLFDERRAVGGGLSEIEARVYAAVGDDPILQDAVMGLLPALAPGEVLAAFTSLELKGWVRRLPGQLIVRRSRA